ncbi:MAG: prepilin-type N-terminal cleavage/methylation domain-containing protein [Holosporaceae bacterium]|jgi:prepilin-type N-terminal cleavage/methylation domain-containing protein|nr:prepilin-type N-terminal cleavage/methylation domain-containing protein [Holosporaceae bacterium]
MNRNKSENQLWRRSKSGFSLLEVAIAIVVISIIAGFALKGKELIRSAQLRSVSEQVNAFRIATQLFLDKYGALPGNLTNAVEIFDSSVANGDGSGNISSLADAKRFWQQLAASELVTLELVNGFPVSKIGGYYTISSEMMGHSGIWIVLCGGTGNNQSFSGVISQADAYIIDKSSDSGNPSSGDVRTIRASGNESLGQRYDLRQKDRDCIIMFKIW